MPPSTSQIAIAAAPALGRAADSNVPSPALMWTVVPPSTSADGEPLGGRSNFENAAIGAGVGAAGIVGHIDGPGTAASRHRLSTDRANALVACLARQRIGNERPGADAPIDTDATAAGRAKNRRVEFFVRPIATRTSPPSSGDPLHRTSRHYPRTTVLPSASRPVPCPSASTRPPRAWQRLVNLACLSWMSIGLVACGSDGDPPVVTAPSVVTQPASLSVAAGQTATFSVIASGSAPLAYQWRRNGVAVSGATAATYTTPTTTSADNGAQFAVTVGNAAGTATSNVATLTVTTSIAPGIATQPASTTVTAGQTATFGVIATGTAPLAYQWNRNGTPIAGATAGSYTTAATTVADNGASFTVTIVNGAGTIASSAAVLTVQPAAIAPSVATQPAGVTVNAGQTATFTVVATGTAPLVYQWSRDGTAIAGATAISYTTAPTVDADTGARFRVTVTNAAGSAVSDAAVLTVTPAPIAPRITAQPASATATAGQSATFSVAATGSAPLVYQWKRNGVAIGGANAASYTTPATTTADSGAQFTVTIANAAGTVTSDAATLSVNVPLTPPAIASQPVDITVTSGQTATFSVTATGSATLTYQWRRNGVAIAGAVAATYTTPVVASSDSGAVFSVVVGNAAGSVTSGNAVLTVDATVVPVAITGQPANTTVPVGQTATFSVTAIGTAPLTYQWRRGGVAIVGATLASYTTAAVTTADSGAVFSVVVGNARGDVVSSGAVLTVTSAGWVGIRQDGALGSSDDTAKAIATDPNGNVVIAGVVGGKFVATDRSDPGPFVAKYGSGGTLLWAMRIVDNSNVPATDDATGIATDAAGNIYVTGNASGTLPGETASSMNRVFLVKYDPAGNRLWGHQLDLGTRSLTAYGLAVDRAGHAVVTGYSSLSNSTGGYFITKFDANGAQLWYQESQIRGVSSGLATAVALDAAGNAYIGGTSEPNASSARPFVAKYDGNGALIWVSAAILATNRIEANAVAVSSDGSTIYLVGSTDVDFDAPGATLAPTTIYQDVPSGTGPDIFVARFDGQGTRVWNHNLSSLHQLDAFGNLDSRDFGLSATTNADGGFLLIAGQTDGVMPAASSAGAQDIVVARFEADGSRTFVRQFGSHAPSPNTPNDSGRAITLDVNGDAFVAGSTIGTFGTPQKNNDRADWFILKLRNLDGALY